MKCPICLRYGPRGGVPASGARRGRTRSTIGTAAPFDEGGTVVIKVASAAQRHPSNRQLDAFRRYWAVSHGPLFSNSLRLRRYVQHLTLPEAYGVEPAPTFDGVSIFWYDDLEARRLGASGPQADALRQAVIDDDAQLFDRSGDWPTHQRRTNIVAEERIVLDGVTSPEMVKAIFFASRLPGLSLEQFFDQWLRHHGALGERLPGLRRYVQNHAVPEAYAWAGQTHDGWSELWFDDLAALHAAVRSPEWRALREDGTTLFSSPIGVVVASERVQKDDDWTYNDWGVGALDSDQIRHRLLEDGYAALAADDAAPRSIKTAVTREALAVWTNEHLVTLDESHIDARPNRMPGSPG
jgi:uncharacterized protein (TIGR02118 family)